MGLLLVDAFAEGRVRNMVTKEWGDKLPLPAEVVMFDGTDIVDFAYAHPGALDVTRMTCRPPAEQCWVEFDDPVPEDSGARTGVLVRTFGPEHSLYGAAATAVFEPYAWLPAHPEAGVFRWLWQVFIGFNEMGGIAGAADDKIVAAVVCIDDEDAVEAKYRGMPDGGERRQHDRTVAIDQTVDALRIFAACHVRNTTREPLRVTRQVARQRQRRNLVDASGVTVLRIPRSVREAAGPAASADERARARHLVLGHLVHYGNTHPDGQPRGLLFGKYEGVFWKDATWRGAGELGERHHTYKVEPPK